MKKKGDFNKMKEEISEFLRFAIDNNRIRDVEEAFVEYPAEEEWHGGKLENVLNEDSKQYNVYRIGDIVFVKRFLYSNGDCGTNHFFVIVEQNNLAVPIENFGMLISSRIEKLKYKSNIELKKDNLNNLRKDSIVKIDKLYKIDNKQIVYKLGEVTLDKIEEYKAAFMKYK